MSSNMASRLNAWGSISAEDVFNVKASKQSTQRRASHVFPRSLSPGRSPSVGSSSHWMDDAVRSFVERHPSFANEVSRLGPGRYSIRGHVVAGMGQTRKTVSVNGGQRRLSDVLEEFRRLAAFENAAKPGATASKALAELFGNQEQEHLSGYFQSWQKFGQRSADAREYLRRKCWTAWVAGVYVDRANRHHEQLRSRQHRNWLMQGIVQLCLSAWHWWIYVERTTYNVARERGIVDASIAQLRCLQGVVPYVLEHSAAILGAADCAVCFLWWSREVHCSRRRSSEIVLNGRGRVLEQDVKTLEKQIAAKDMLASSFASPEAHLYRLSHVVDSFLGRLNIKESIPQVTSAVRDAVTRHPEARQSAIDVCHDLAVVHKTVAKLQADIEFVLYLRCFSGWVRVAGDTREAHGLRALQMRQDQVWARSRTVTARYDAFFLASDGAKLLRKTFTSWALRAWLVCGHICGSVTSKISACMSKLCQSDSNTHVATSLVESFSCSLPAYTLLAQCCNEHALATILTKWALLVSIEVSKEVQRMKVSLRQARDGRERRRSITQEIGNSRYVRALMLPLRTVFEAWVGHNRGLRLQIRIGRRRASVANWRMQLHYAYVVGQCFHAFAYLLTKSSTRRVLSQHLLFRCFGEYFSLFERCLHAWRIGVFEQQSERLSVQRQQCHQQLKSQAMLVFALRGDVDSDASKHLILRRWLECCMTARHHSVRNSMEAERRQLERSVQMMRRRACDWRDRVDEHVVAAWDAPLRHAAFIQWASSVLRAKQEQHVASEWIQRQRGQDRLCKELAQYQSNKERLLQYARMVVEGSFGSQLPHIFSCWRLAVQGCTLRYQIFLRTSFWIQRSLSYMVFKFWSCNVVQGRMRLAAFRYGHALVTAAQLNFGSRVLLLWRSLVATRVSWISARRLLTLQGIVPLMLRAPRAAFHHWRRNSQDCGGESQKGRIVFLRTKESLTYLYSAFKIWAIAAEEERQKRYRMLSQPLKDALSSQSIVDAAVQEHVRRTSAERRFARWSNLEESDRTLIPKYFAAWTLAQLEDHTEARANLVSYRVAEMRVRYRSAAESLLVRAVSHKHRLYRSLQCWFAFILSSRSRLQRSRTVKRECMFVESAGNVLMYIIEGVLMRQCIDAWRCYRQHGLHSLQLERQTTFKAKAGELARRIVGLNNRAFGLLTAARAWIAWCASTWQCEHLLQISLGRRLERCIPIVILSRVICRLEFRPFSTWSDFVRALQQKRRFTLDMVTRTQLQLLWRSACHLFLAWASRAHLLRYGSRVLEKSKRAYGGFHCRLVLVSWSLLVKSRRYLDFAARPPDEEESQRTTSPPWSPQAQTPEILGPRSRVTLGDMMLTPSSDSSPFRGATSPSSSAAVSRFSSSLASFSQPRLGASDPRTLGYSAAESGRTSTTNKSPLATMQRDSEWAAAKKAFGSSSSLRGTGDAAVVREQRYPWPSPSYV